MNNQYLIKSVLLCLAIVSSNTLQAETFQLESAVAYALEHNPNLKAVQQQLHAASADSRASRAGNLPTLTLSHTARVSDNPLDAFADKLNTRQVRTPDFEPAALNQPGSSDLYFTQLSLRWSLYSGGRLSALIDTAEATEDNRRQHYQREREYTAYETMRAYLSALSAEQARVIAQDAVEAARQHAATTKKLAAEDRIVESDKLAAEVNFAAVRAQYEQALTRARMALDDLRLAMGLPLDAELILSTAKLKAQTETAAVADYEKQALAQRKDLAAARAQILAAKARLEAARAANKPSIDLVASSNWYDDEPGFDSHSSSIMGVLSFDLYDGQRDGRVDSALAQQRETQWQLQALEQTVRKQVRDTYNRLLESRARLSIAEDNVATAQRTVKLVKQRYGQSRTILLDLLQAERIYTEARSEKLNAELNLELATAALPLATGSMSLPAEESP